MLKAEQVDEFSRELAALNELGQEIAKVSQEIARPSVDFARAGLEEKLREYLERARKLAEKFGPESFSVSVGFPLGVQVSLTWSSEGRS